MKALVAGALGGGLVGAADAVAAVLRGPAGGRPGAVIVLGLAAGAAVGLSLAAVLLGVAALTARLRPRLDRPRALAVAAAVVAAPLLAYDAFALFRGPQASRIPAHGALSVLVCAAGLAAVALFATLFLRLVERVRAGGRLAAVAGVVGLALTGLALHEVNRRVLPRLYPWFHASLSLALVVTGALAAAIVLCQARPRGRAFALSAAGALLAVVAVAASGFWGSQSVRFVAYEKTQVASLVLKAAPIPRPRPVRARTHRPIVADDTSPLPDGPRAPDADVVIITVDALRADHVGAYGYGRNITPNIDALARRGVRFNRAYAQAPHTSFSVASMLTGKYYPTLARLSPGDPHDPIAVIFRQYGWKTAAFYPPAVFFVDAHRLKAYQESNFQFEYFKVEFMDADKRLDQIDEFFRLERPDKAFLWLHLFEPHEPYDKRPGFDFGDRDIDRYDSEIAYADAVVGKLLAYLERHRPGAIVVLTADHGEEFDEHKGRYHGVTLYEEQIRVPLIIAGPGIGPHVISAPVELIDIAPTLLGLLDIPVPVRMRGTDLGPWLGTPPAPERRLPPAFAEVNDKRMVVLGLEKLICDMNWGYCELYDLAKDPGEKQNIAEARPERVAALRARLDDWLDDHLRYEPQLARGLANPEGGPVPKAIERGRLGDLTYVGALADLLRSNEPLPIRREAARLLVVNLPRRRETAEKVRAAMTADDAYVRDWATAASVRLGDASAAARAREVLGRTPAAGDEELRLHTALALAQWAGDGTGLDVLTGALDRCDDRVALCGLIITVLGRLRDPRAVPGVLKHIAEVQNRRERVAALGEIGDAAAVPALVDRLKGDEYVPVRQEAALSLGKIGGADAEAALARSAREEREEIVADAARAALERLRRGVGDSGVPR